MISIYLVGYMLGSTKVKHEWDKLTYENEDLKIKLAKKHSISHGNG
jgi:hypothetical protein